VLAPDPLNEDVEKWGKEIMLKVEELSVKQIIFHPTLYIELDDVSLLGKSTATLPEKYFDSTLSFPLFKQYQR
jgi:hypothetical protein